MNKNKIIGRVLMSPFIVAGLVTLIFFLADFNGDHSYMLIVGPILAVLFILFLIGLAMFTKKLKQ